MSSTRQTLLKETEKLLRTRGYTGFSYADLANKIKIRKASIHHHFPTKENLGLSLVEAYFADFTAALEDLDRQDLDAVKKLEFYSSEFSKSLENHELPLCGALAAELKTLPPSMKKKTLEFFEFHLAWLTKIIAAGVREGTFRPDVDPALAAGFILSLLEGASLVHWVVGKQIAIEPLLRLAILNLK